MLTGAMRDFLYGLADAFDENPEAKVTDDAISAELRYLNKSATEYLKAPLGYPAGLATTLQEGVAGAQGGEIDVEQLARVVRAILDCLKVRGYDDVSLVAAARESLGLKALPGPRELTAVAAIENQEGAVRERPGATALNQQSTLSFKGFQIRPARRRAAG